MTTPPLQSPLDVLLDAYCATSLPAGAKPGEQLPRQHTKATMANHAVQAFINGDAFFRAIDQEITNLIASSARGRFFYMTAWWLGLIEYHGDLQVQHRGKIVQDGQLQTDPQWTHALDAEAFVLPSSGQSLLNRLRDLARSGVTVRVLAWASPFITIPQVGQQVGDVVFHTLLSVRELRQSPLAATDVMINCLAHSLGAAHCKLVVCGEQATAQGTMRAYASGLDPEASRLISPTGALRQGWHDAGVKVEGSAAGAIHDFFKSMWEEQRARPVERFNLNGAEIASHDPAAPALLSRETPSLPANTGKQYVQVLRTAPQMNFGQLGAQRRGKLLISALSPWKQLILGFFANRSNFVRPPLGFAPTGTFEFKVALRHAIEHAENYIFIADQGLYALEVMDWIRDRVLRRPSLKIIFVYGADPHDQPNGFLAEALHKHLAPGLPFRLDSGLTNVVFYEWLGRAVHCKVTIIDDTWCAIGSANCMRRSLYTDIELSLGILEPPTPEANLPTNERAEQDPGTYGKQAPSFVQRFRRDLWAGYCAQSSPRARAMLLPLRNAIHIWNDEWGVGSAVALRPDLRRVRLPWPGKKIAEVPPFTQLEYDFQDADSRQPF